MFIPNGLTEMSRIQSMANRMQVRQRHASSLVNLPAQLGVPQTKGRMGGGGSSSTYAGRGVFKTAPKNG
jgi:hypothetical protein